MTIRILFLLVLLTSILETAHAFDTSRQEIKQFINNMVTQHGFEKNKIESIISSAISQESILQAISRPAEKTLTWQKYRNIFLKPERIKKGVKFWKQHHDTLLKISDKTGVNAEIIIGIIGVETYFGRITGNYSVLNALCTLAFDYPRRSPFFTKELEHFLLLSREEGMNPQQATGSYAGAMGKPQFMPSSFRAYAVDANGDGKIDIWNDWQDVIGSIANYLVQRDWQRGNEIITKAEFKDSSKKITPENSLKAIDNVSSLKEKGIIFDTHMSKDHPSQLLFFDGEVDEYWVGFHNFFVITTYNRSIMYALAVYQLGQEITSEINLVSN